MTVALFLIGFFLGLIIGVVAGAIIMAADDPLNKELPY